MRGMSVESIIKGLRPEQDMVDRRILYELAGIRLDEADFQQDLSSFESDQEEDSQHDLGG